jgi:hypothetical protein
VVAPCDAVDDLAYRSISSDDDDQLRSRFDGVARERGQISTCTREEGVAVQARRRRTMCDLGPPAPGRTVRRRWVDEKDRLGQWSVTLPAALGGGWRAITLRDPASSVGLGQ